MHPANKPAYMLGGAVTIAALLPWYITVPGLVAVGAWWWQRRRVRGVAP